MPTSDQSAGSEPVKRQPDTTGSVQNQHIAYGEPGPRRNEDVFKPFPTSTTAAAPDPEPRLATPGTRQNEDVFKPTFTVPDSEITEDDRRRQIERAEQEREQARHKYRELLVTDELVRLPQFLSGSFVVLTFLGLAGVLGLFALNQVFSALAALTMQPRWLYFTGLAAVVGLLSLVLYVVGRAGTAFWRLRRSPCIRLGQLEGIARQARLRWLANEIKGDAIKDLRKYVQDYPADAKSLGNLGLDCSVLASARSKLLNNTLIGGNEDWLESFRSDFQRHLDKKADEEIGMAAKQIALATAASPNALLDTCLTLMTGFKLLTRLCQLYDARTGSLGMLVLMSRILFQGYAAGQLDENEGTISAGLSDGAQALGIEHVADASVGVVLGKLGAKVTAGAANYLFMKRLGRRAKAVLQPLST